MKKNNIIVSILFFLGIVSAKGQYTDIHDFVGGVKPSGAVTVSYTGDTLFGMVPGGGTPGYVFCIRTDGSGFTILLNFDGTSNPQGEDALGDLTLSGKVLFGITTDGGTNGVGNIFSVHTDGTGYVDLHDFNASLEGEYPRSSVVLSAGVLYGATGLGGVNGWGSIFSIHTDGTAYTDLYDFASDGSNGTMGSPLILSGGVLYGTSSKGGAYDYGNIYSIHTDGSGFTDIHDFDNTGGGFSPEGNVTSSVTGDSLFGMANSGGATSTSSYDTVFSIKIDGSGYKDIHNFNDTMGAHPYGSLSIMDNKLYGMTNLGGETTSLGVLFTINPDGSGFSDLLNFDGSSSISPQGAYPYGGITFSGDTLFGMTVGGGIYPDFFGVLYRYTIPSPPPLPPTKYYCH